MNRRSLLTLIAIAGTAAAYNVTISVNTDLDTHAISPYIYGTNQVLSNADNYTAERMGGNRLTAYNWENNASNAGTDWNNSSDNYMTQGLSAAQALTPAITITTFIDTCRKYNRFCLATFQMAGFVARDKSGNVTSGQVAPSSRWRYVFPAKPTAFDAVPDTGDSAVYMDECMNYLKTKYASFPDGWLGGICLDNEPALWPSTHPLVHPDAPTCAELVDKSIELAGAIRAVDTRPLIFGHVAYGFGELTDFQGASDWNSVKGKYSWFVDYYLDKMRAASATAGRRLLDVYDIHWYSEAQGNGERIVGASNPANRANAEARIQAPRTLWDTHYVEDSWIGEWFSDYLPLLPRLQKSINSYYPDTKISITEYNYGGENHISGGLAMADALGIYGKYNVFCATYWQMETATKFTSAAFRLFRNYNGGNAAFGNLWVRATTSDSVRTSVYASIASSSNKELHLVLLNKQYDSTMNATITVNSASAYQTVRVWSFDSASATITERQPAPAISNNTITYSIPRLTACHFVLSPISEVRTVVPFPAKSAFSCKATLQRLTIGYSFTGCDKGRFALYTLNGSLIKEWRDVSGHGTISLDRAITGKSMKNIIIVWESAGKATARRGILQ
jgi:mannan endo-1,4-beta-mannosidase